MIAAIRQTKFTRIQGTLRGIQPCRGAISTCQGSTAALQYFSGIQR
jgi:hypothetical protein